MAKFNNNPNFINHYSVCLNPYVHTRKKLGIGFGYGSSLPIPKTHTHGISRLVGFIPRPIPMKPRFDGFHSQAHTYETQIGGFHTQTHTHETQI